MWITGWWWSEFWEFCFLPIMNHESQGAGCSLRKEAEDGLFILKIGADLLDGLAPDLAKGMKFCFIDCESMVTSRCPVKSAGIGLFEFWSF